MQGPAPFSNRLLQHTQFVTIIAHMEDVFNVIAELSIPYELLTHPAVFTVEEADIHMSDMEAGKTKNLFVRNKKKTQYYLLVVESTKRINLKEVSQQLQESNLSFASPEDLHKYLGITPGSVSPFGLIHDTEKKVHVVIDSDIMTYERVGFHPNINTQTVILSSEDFKKYLESTGNGVQYMKL